MAETNDTVTVAPYDAATDNTAASTQAESGQPDQLPDDAREAAPVGAMVNGRVVQPDGSTADVHQHSGADGIRLPSAEIGGGQIDEHIRADAPPPSSVTQAKLVERAARSSFALKLAQLVGRPISEWGLLGQGMKVAGHMILLDLESGEKLRVTGDATIKDDRVLANVRNFPHAVVTDQTLEALRGA